MIKGWKTVTGSIAVALGGALLATAEIAMHNIQYLTAAWPVWLKMLGTLLATFGTGLLGYGVAHKFKKVGGLVDPPATGTGLTPEEVAQIKRMADRANARKEKKV